jgi:hypothetical protein
MRISGYILNEKKAMKVRIKKAHGGAMYESPKKISLAEPKKFAHSEDIFLKRTLTHPLNPPMQGTPIIK